MCIDRTYNLFNKCRNIAILIFVYGQITPCRINSKLFIFPTTIYSCIVLIDDILSLLSVRLHDECLHLLNCKISRYNLCYAEECRLKNGIGTIAQTNLLRNLGCIDIINLDIVLCKISLHFVGNEVNEFIAFENGIQQESPIVA